MSTEHDNAILFLLYVNSLRKKQTFFYIVYPGKCLKRFQESVTVFTSERLTYTCIYDDFLMAFWSLIRDQ